MPGREGAAAGHVNPSGPVSLSLKWFLWNIINPRKRLQRSLLLGGPTVLREAPSPSLLTVVFFPK